ncbi:Hpt domain-containing protein [Vibrio sp. SM6]|uniref:Hpt domain-containing protein n=1 Tax=Vibrio agarilyticus TaxID=2726741 RepID=A0A7X8TTB2_9VIBR|nr:Hpt domain-containing protein [Vibrio agarilyticus]NLS13918.1 Hpt domain-containing protein [Vibrio agarilyticus]
MEILNVEKVTALAHDIGEQHMPTLLTIFVRELEEYSEQLQENRDDDQYMITISHALKSSAGSFGADALCTLAQQIDAAAKQGDRAQVQHAQVAMIATLNETLMAYQRLIHAGINLHSNV